MATHGYQNAFFEYREREGIQKRKQYPNHKHVQEEYIPLSKDLIMEAFNMFGEQIVHQNTAYYWIGEIFQHSKKP